MSDPITSLVYSFGALFVILNPLLSVPIFAAMTKGLPSGEVNRQALIAVAVAGALMYIFLFFNFIIFDFLGITFPSFQVAGGFLLFILGIQEALGIEIGRSRDHSHTAAGVVIGTPLLCGPGTITNVLLLSKDYGAAITFGAITLSLLVTWVILRYADIIQRHLGEVVTDVMAKVLGMLLAAIAIQIMYQGVTGLITGVAA